MYAPEGAGDSREALLKKLAGSEGGWNFQSYLSNRIACSVSGKFYFSWYRKQVRAISLWKFFECDSWRLTRENYILYKCWAYNVSKDYSERIFKRSIKINANYALKRLITYYAIVQLVCDLLCFNIYLILCFKYYVSLNFNIMQLHVPAISSSR